MDVFSSYLEGIDQSDHRHRMDGILTWVQETFPQLEPAIKWNTPMFTDHGTFIIGISTAKHHVSVAPEEVTMVHFADRIKEAGYSATKRLFRIPWKDSVDYKLLEDMITYNIQEKAEFTGFWRK